MISTRNETEKKRGADPYRPHVRATPSNDAQFVLETDEELPTGTGKRMRDEIMDPVRGYDSC
jgi:hypothetical protein